MNHYVYRPQGVCAKVVEFDIDKNQNLHNVKFVGGCNGNLQAIAKLVEGKPANEISKTFQDIKCGNKSTSCADQLSQLINTTIKNSNDKGE